MGFATKTGFILGENMENLLVLLQKYNTYDASELIMKNQIIDFIKTEKNIFGKMNQKGHITASSWIINANATHALMTHHSKLDRWLQPGGHTDEGEDVLSGAIREAKEETGLKNLKVASTELFDVDVHLIPERKGVTEHFHYDIRFLMIASMKEPLVLTHESKDLKWFSLEELDRMGFDPSIQRMVEKTKFLDKFMIDV
jgi:8-oxo-dGTP pyrophosphatase MutT (NUDIX family)